MSLEIAALRYPEAFSVITCPVCGESEWTCFPGEGTYCDECNCKVELRPTIGDPGFIADFDADHCHRPEFPGGPARSALIPKSDARGRLATAKYLEFGTTPQLQWISVFAESWEDVETDWKPAWERSDPPATDPATP